MLIGCLFSVARERKHKYMFPELQYVNRITQIPLVETGWCYAGNIYNRIKVSQFEYYNDRSLQYFIIFQKFNTLVYWTFGQAESTFYTVLDTAMPAVILFEGPLHAVDKILCKSLDIVEQRVPQINLPPQMVN